MQVGPRLFYIDSARNKVNDVKINKLHGSMAGYAVGQRLDTDRQIALDGYLKNEWLGERFYGCGYIGYASYDRLGKICIQRKGAKMPA